MGPLISGKSRLVKYYNLARIYLANLLESAEKPLVSLDFSGILHVSSCILGTVEAFIYQEKKVFQTLF